MALVLVALAVAIGCDKQRRDTKSGRSAGTHAYSSFDRPVPGDKVFPAQTLKFEDANLNRVLSVYAEVSGRSVIRGANLPDVKITFVNQAAITTVELLRLLDTVLAAQGVAMVCSGKEYVKAVRSNEAVKEVGPMIELPTEQLPDSSSFLIYVVKLRRVKHTDASVALHPYSSFPGSIIGIGPGKDARSWLKVNLASLVSFIGAEDGSFLVLRDYSSNVRRMLQVLQDMEKR